MDGTATLWTGPGPEGQIELSVEDQGVNIPYEELDKVSCLYYTPRPELNGIGLALLCRIVRMHGGAVRIRAPEAQGAMVTIPPPQLAAKEIALATLAPS